MVPLGKRNGSMDFIGPSPLPLDNDFDCILTTTDPTYSSPRAISLDLSNLTTAGSIHSVIRNSRHTISKSIINVDTTSTLDATDGINGTASSSSIIPSPSSSLFKVQKIKGRIQFAVLCWSLFLLGWNDGCTGPLLPRIQEEYHVGFVIVSLIFVLSSVGGILGAVANIYLTDKIGFGKTIVLGSFLPVIAYAIQSSAPPFPVFVMAYFINGMGMTFQDAQANGFVAALTNNEETKMGFLHAAYGLGAFTSPFIATQFAQLPRWSFNFLVSLGFAMTNVTFLICVFKLKRQNACLSQAGEIIPEKEPMETSSNEKNTGSYKNILTTPAVHLLALFILFYVGAEVTIGGWIVTFIIDVRGGGASSGYISSGFFGGLTIGRIALLWINKRVGERRILFVYAFLAIGLELTIWFIPSLIGNAIAISFIGVLFGPMFPLVMNYASCILPRRNLTGSIGWIVGFGSAGSAVIPFITGVISSKKGIQSLQPLLITMMGIMIVLWALVPLSIRRAD